MEVSKEEIEKIMKKYRARLNLEFNISEDDLSGKVSGKSREYVQFKKEFMPKHMNLYEKACNGSVKLLKISPDKKRRKKLVDDIDICHLNITPEGAASLAVLLPVIVALLGMFFGIMLLESMFFTFIFMIFGMTLYLVLNRLPDFLANSWRMQASNQMVLCIFYVVTYMRHTSNLELAIDFGAEHLSGPLSLDLKKVLWNVETEKYESVKESLDNYLETWRKWNMEFIEAFHLIESSLYEPSDDRRLNLLDKSLTVILEETYEKMLHYAQNLKSPITMLHMMGIILPILGLVILPLVVSFMEGIAWYHIAMLYNIIIPVSVFYLGKSILASRPTGYGDTDISDENPELKKFKNVLIKIGNKELAISPLIFSVMIFIVLFAIAISPPLLFKGGFPDITLMDGSMKLFDYKEDLTTGEIIGPFGMGAAIISICMPLAFGLGIGAYYKLRSSNIIKIRENAKKLESEFASALFQLGNRLGDGIPSEIAFDKVANTMDGTISGNFFKVVSMNITKMGMSVKEAIFNQRSGALVYFPSKIIESAMKVLIESSKKGPKIAANALLNVSRYIKEMHKVNERLKDLMSDIISSMKSQINFLTPVIAGIVVGITSMVTNILGRLSDQLGDMSTGDEAAAGLAGITSLFGYGLPTYHFQMIVGLYVVEIILILTILVNGIENGSDKLNENYLIGRNLIRVTLLYCIMAFAIMLLFNLIAASIMDVSMGM